MERIKNKKDRFILKAMEVHKGENLDYSKVEYKNNRTNVCIIDPVYGEYWQTPSNHLKGQCHPMRRNNKISESKRTSFDKLIERFHKAHPGENLDYSKSVYVNMHTPILIIDHDIDLNGNEYGEFMQEPNAHLKGCRHPRKAIDFQKRPTAHSTESIIAKFIEVHGNKYLYDKVEYNKYREPVSIICRKHGEFKQTPENHIEGKGCPICGYSISKMEDDVVKMLNEKGIECKRRERTILNGMEIDIYCPDKKVGIEMDGLRWHCEWKNGKDRYYHLSKTNMCESNGIRLIHVFEDEYNKHREIVLDKISHILGLSIGKPKVYARKCSISRIDKNTAMGFLNRNHIQGFASSTIYYGAYMDGEIIGCMTFKLVGGEWELNRFATHVDYNCIGLGGKMFNKFVLENDPDIVKSFADRRWSFEGQNLYTNIGFELLCKTEPDYYYVDMSKGARNRYHKFRFRKQIISRKYGFPMTITETEMVKKLGYDRIWNCGLLKYIWKKK